MTIRVFVRRHVLLIGCSLAASVAWAADPPADTTSESPPAATQPAETTDADPAEAAPSKATAGAAAIDAKTPAVEAASRRRTEDEYFELYKSLADTLDQVERNYVKPVDRRELMEAAIKGVLSKLDPHSSYIGPDEMSGFRNAVESQFGGIGIQITFDDGQLKVSSPLVGTPAYRAGVQSGDKFVKIEGEPTQHFTLDEAVRRLKGAVGTSVTFTVQHVLTGKQETFTIKRELIHVDTVLGDTRKPDDSWSFMLDPEKRIGYIRLTAFSRDTARDLRTALEELQQQKLRGLILDLRFNPGGLLTSATEVADLFLSRGRIVSTTGRNVAEKVWDAVEPGTFQGFPMVVLVNRYSASASEIVAACLQDHDRAVVIGERTWGKGSVQNVVELEAGRSALKLTTSTYTRPNGHNIHRFPEAKETDEWGVKPSEGFEVQLRDGEMAALLTDRRLRDIVLAKPPREESIARSDAASSTEKVEAPSANRGPADDTSASQPKPTTPATAAETDAKSDKPKADAANPPAPSTKFVDRQLQKGLEYLTTELARAP